MTSSLTLSGLSRSDGGSLSVSRGQMRYTLAQTTSCRRWCACTDLCNSELITRSPRPAYGATCLWVRARSAAWTLNACVTSSTPRSRTCANASLWASFLSARRGRIGTICEVSVSCIALGLLIGFFWLAFRLLISSLLMSSLMWRCACRRRVQLPR
jgi:hypothetical protein